MEATTPKREWWSEQHWAALQEIVPRHELQYGGVDWTAVKEEWEAQTGTVRSTNSMKLKWGKHHRAKSKAKVEAEPSVAALTTAIMAVCVDDKPRYPLAIDDVPRQSTSSSSPPAAAVLAEAVHQQQHPEVMYKHTVDPDRQIFVMSPEHPLRMSDTFVKAIVKNADKFAYFSGTPDKRSNGESLKSEQWTKSSGMGQGPHTLWCSSVATGTPDERALTFEEHFDPHTGATYHGTFGRPFLPTEAEMRKGTGLVKGPEAVPEIHDEMENHAKQGAAAKRILNPVSAAEDEKATEPTFAYTSNATGFIELPIKIAYLGVPGWTGATLNLTLQYDTPQTKGQEQWVTHSDDSLREGWYEILSTFPPESQGSAKMHADTLDKMKLEHLGMPHYSLSTLNLWMYDPYNIMIGGMYYAAIGKKDARGKLPKAGATLAVSARHACPMVAHQSQFMHMAGGVGSTRATTALEGDVVDALQTGRRMLTRGSADETSLKRVGARGSVVLHTSKGPVRTAAGVRRARGVAFAYNSRQKRELVSLGLLPLNTNEKTRPKHAALKAKVENYPINGPRELCTVEAMAPFCAAALAHKDAIMAMGDSDEYSSEPEEDEAEDDDSPEPAAAVDGSIGKRARSSPERLGW